MPSPVGHALAGIAAGTLVAVSASKVRAGGRALDMLMRVRVSRDPLLFGLLGMLPDVDFLLGSHSAYTHSIGAVVIVGLFGALLAAGPPAFRVRYGVAVGLAYGSHVLLDWLGTDDTAPFGVMALWPFSTSFFVSDRRWFLAVCRRYDEPSCWLQNAQGVAWEILILGPLAVGARLLAKRR